MSSVDWFAEAPHDDDFLRFESMDTQDHPSLEIFSHPRVVENASQTQVGPINHLQLMRDTVQALSNSTTPGHPPPNVLDISRQPFSAEDTVTDFRPFPQLLAPYGHLPWALPLAGNPPLLPNYPDTNNSDQAMAIQNLTHEIMDDVSGQILQHLAFGADSTQSLYGLDHGDVNTQGIPSDFPGYDVSVTGSAVDYQTRSYPDRPPDTAILPVGSFLAPGSVTPSPSILPQPLNSDGGLQRPLQNAETAEQIQSVFRTQKQRRHVHKRYSKEV